MPVPDGQPTGDVDGDGEPYWPPVTPRTGPESCSELAAQALEAPPLEPSSGVSVVRCTCN